MKHKRDHTPRHKKLQVSRTTQSVKKSKNHTKNKSTHKKRSISPQNFPVVPIIISEPDIENQLHRLSPMVEADIENQIGDYGSIQRKINEEKIKQLKLEDFDRYMYKPVGQPYHVPNQTLNEKLDTIINDIEYNIPSNKNVNIGYDYGIYDENFKGGQKKGDKRKTYKKHKTLRKNKNERK
jgi:hypothetical protein